VNGGRTIRSLIDDRLAETGQSQAAAAAALGISQATMSRWRSGEHSPEPRYLAALAAWLDMPADDLLAVWAGNQAAKPARITTDELAERVRHLAAQVAALERRLRRRR
jgi:transcriptional regulator with XRE-family HTH domain